MRPLSALTAPAGLLPVTAGLIRGIGFSVPVEPDRGTARGWATQELAKPEYQRSLLQRILGWLYDQLQHLPAAGGRGIQLTAVVVLVVLAVVIAVAARRSGTLRRRAERAGSVFADPTRSAADHRAAAEAAELRGDWPSAVIERFRALTRELEDRAVLVPQPGRTADEVAAEAGAWLPDLAAALREGAAVFDDVRYGDHPATADAARRLRELDDAVRRARPARMAAMPASAGPVAPR